MIALVREDHVAGLGQRRQHGEVGEVAAREIERALGALERARTAVRRSRSTSRSPRSSREPVLPHAFARDRRRRTRRVTRGSLRRDPGSRSRRDRCRTAAAASAAGPAASRSRQARADARVRGAIRRHAPAPAAPARSAACRACRTAARRASSPGFGVVSSRSPRNTELAPARKQSACASSVSDSRPALSRTIDAGIRMRAVAIVRTSSSGSSGAQVGQRRALDAHQQVDRHALRMRIERRQLPQQAVADARDPRPCR